MWSLLKWTAGYIQISPETNLTTEDRVSWGRTHRLRPCFPRGRGWCCLEKGWGSWISRLRSKGPAQWRDDEPPAGPCSCCRAAGSRPHSLDHRRGPQHTRPPHHLTVQAQHHHDSVLGSNTNTTANFTDHYQRTVMIRYFPSLTLGYCIILTFSEVAWNT